ncbi:uncharacterized protein TRAVEDRAFT_20369 [Trametes versicolor FP-101664 SS1]|uniref:uncharacterized protein n=1 Tax=Trametes versicolor (strain FP-101664) TaxID=717944 RepID=UPI0004622D92|nr:uncharacterized protein TRAVEDRAFT_20369 [Trametes versicolor FP-101664 SS1]EIW58332.1 hypothetical protein TRAVEDRAFT_20369 [Trametes versicolor FP-101664 SS1]
METTVYARETSCIPSENPYHPDTFVQHFDVPLVPRVPLHVGQRVKIVTLTLHARDLPANGGYTPPCYSAQDSGVVGEVTRVRSTNSAVTEFIVQNENDTSPIIFACLAIQHIQGQTVRMGLWESIIRQIVRPPAPERCIPLELDATVVREGEVPRQQRTGNGRTE